MPVVATPSYCFGNSSAGTRLPSDRGEPRRSPLVLAKSWAAVRASYQYARLLMVRRGI